MSELIQTHDNRATIRWKLLTSASALALTISIASAGAAKADDTNRPMLWIELGGQMEQIEGLSAPVAARFMSFTPTPDVYNGVGFISNQNVARYSFGEEASISFQPEDSDWIFSAGVRYGRSHSLRHTHKQAVVASVPYTVHYTFGGVYAYSYQASKYFQANRLADVKTQSSEQHLVLDFQAGKDVGLGLFGNQGSSQINAGVRIASFTGNSSATITARPSVAAVPVTHSRYSGYLVVHRMGRKFDQYTLHADAARDFRGIGPALSWNASAAIAGNPQDGELALDWGVNAALLFGKQKARVHHETQNYHYFRDGYNYTASNAYTLTYDRPHHSTRSRSVTVPNIGGFAGLSLKWTNAKISLGYRVDSFFGAMDTGIDAAKKSNLTFNGPYASISVGLGD